ncbi:hypothetical protein [Rubripirellula obstinata]|nr:hypothetical protein [Rubripirellula obstinata]
MTITRINGAIEQLFPNLEEFIENTEAKVQPRKDYPIERDDVGGITSKTQFEIKIERALWSKYHEHKSSEASPFLPTCPRIVGYQVPLFNQDNQQGWGEIDLIGASPNGMPVPIELKQDTGENVLKMIVQSAAYSIAVRKVWNLPNSPFQKCWQSLALGNELPKEMSEINCICLATEAYWKRARGNASGRRSEGQIMPDSWPLINRLVEKFSEHGIQVSFASVVLAPELPTISSCSQEQLPI